MKTFQFSDKQLERFKSSSNVIERLTHAVIQQGVEPDQFVEIAEHGADAGFNGFIYYNETVKFYDENVELIWDLLHEYHEQLGYSNVLELIASLAGAKHVCKEAQFKNLLTWFALEEVARHWSDS